ncbi:mitochondrial carrier [Imleria badia]|nr:mitochondrial carrier [Imleria badia]
MSSPYTSTINDLIAGSFGGAAQVLVGQPLDTIKTRAQIAPKGMFKGPMDILVQTVRKEGFFALYKGMASPLLGIAGVNSLLFAAYAASKRVVSPFPDLSIQQIALAGGMAGAINSILASPVEMFKVRMQGQYGSASDKRLRTVAREMWKEWGFTRGIMRGYWVGFLLSKLARFISPERHVGPTGMTISTHIFTVGLSDIVCRQVTVAREIPAYAGFYSAFEFSKRQFQGIYGEQIPVWALLASGSTGGIAYWLSCYPLDVIKSRIQLRPTPPTSRPWTYINEELRAIISEGGFKGLFRGLSPSRESSHLFCPFWRSGYTHHASAMTVLRSIPAAGSTFAAYELTREYLRESTGA